MSYSSDKPLLSNQLPISIEIPDPQDKDFVEIITDLFRTMCNVINTKEGAHYSLVENASFNRFYTPNLPNVFRNVYRKNFDMVAVNGGPITVSSLVVAPHSIFGIVTPFKLNGSATSSSAFYLSLPHVSLLATTDQIEIFADATNIYLKTGTTIAGGAYTLTQANIIFEYTKN